MLFAGRRRCHQDTARLTGGQAAEARQFAQFTIAVRREIRFVDDFQLHPEIVMRNMSFSECSSEISGFPISYFAGALAAGEPGAPQKQIPAVLRLLPGGREQHRMLAVPLRGRSRRLVVGAGLQFVPSSQLFPPFS